MSTYNQGSDPGDPPPVTTNEDIVTAVQALNDTLTQLIYVALPPLQQEIEKLNAELLEVRPRPKKG